MMVLAGKGKPISEMSIDYSKDEMLPLWVQGVYNNHMIY